MHVEGPGGALWLRQINGISRCAMELFARCPFRELRTGKGQCEDKTLSLDCQPKQMLKTRYSLVATAPVKILLLPATGQNDFSKYISVFFVCLFVRLNQELYVFANSS